MGQLQSVRSRKKIFLSRFPQNVHLVSAPAASEVRQWRLYLLFPSRLVKFVTSYEGESSDNGYFLRIIVVGVEVKIFRPLFGIYLGWFPFKKKPLFIKNRFVEM